MYICICGSSHCQDRSDVDHLKLLMQFCSLILETCATEAVPTLYVGVVESMAVVLSFKYCF